MKYQNTYSIKDLEILSGIKAHTIRIWEVRYGLLTPLRTDTNIRLYSDEDLKRLLNIAFLLKNGLKISKISLLNEQEIHDKVLEQYNDIHSEQAIDTTINNLLVSMIELNEILFESIFSQSIKNIGFKNTIIKIIYPFLSKIGVLWTINNILPAQEHFISNLIRQKLVAACDQQILPTKPSKKFLLFLPEGEMHEIGLLLANYVIRQHQHQTIYLGQNVPQDDIVQICKQFKPDYALSFITAPQTEEELKNLFKTITKALPKGKFLVSGGLAHFNFKLPPQVTYLFSVTDLEALM